MKRTTKILGLDIQVKASEVISYSDYVGRGYGQTTQEGIKAIKVVAEREGISLDPIYTGKVMSGLIDHSKQEKNYFPSYRRISGTAPY